MSNCFDVLSRNLKIHKNYLLEASAGTGKTFSIENIVVRLLVEEDPESQQVSLLEQILVVTFTRAATRDLKIRVRTTIERAVAILRGLQNSSIPDYLQVILETGKTKVDTAKRRLEQALATFDQAQIYTIHGFCMRMLNHFVFESNFHINPKNLEEKNLNKNEILQLIRDFFRTEIRPEIYSTAQLQIILNAHGNKIEQVQETLMKLLQNDSSISPTADFSSDFKTFNSLMDRLKNACGLHPEKLQEDFEKQKDCYKVIKNKDISSVYDFFNLFSKADWSSDEFDLLLREGLLICEYLDPDNIKKRKKIPDPNCLHYPDLMTLLLPLKCLIDQARSYEFILARMAYNCRQLMQKYLIEEEKYQESDLLKYMHKALENPLFSCKVRSLYRAAIIDEFQDTDPIQWEIFQKLFLDESLKKGLKNSKNYIYLVGDPKQSIYAFRQADIYTYLNAARALGDENRASLDTNYRSQPSLVAGLNILFQACPKMFGLPTLSDSTISLDCPIAKTSCSAKNKTFSDSLGSIHFFSAEVKPKSSQNLPSTQHEEDFYFPFMAHEIIRLHKIDKLNFNEFAVLIKDKYQAQRLAHFFHRYNIPYTMQRQASLVESTAWDSLKELLVAVLNPRNENSIRIALGGGIFGWNYNEVKALNNPSLLEQVLAQFHHFKQQLLSVGFSSFFYQFMHFKWQPEELTIAEKLLQQEGGDTFYDELNQIANLLIEHQSESPISAEDLIELLEVCKKVPAENEDRLKKFADPTRDAVAILTTHNSKGLEYPIVFAYGLVTRPKTNEMLIPKREGLSQSLIPCLDKNEEIYKNYCEELDAEKMRQLYVAMTRAKYRLYVPLIFITPCKDPIESKSKTLDLGCASPMELFLARLGRDPCSYEEIYQRISDEDGKELEELIHAHPEAKITHTCLNETSLSLERLDSEKSISLVSPENVHVPGEQYFMQSFTSLSKYKKADVEYIIADTPHHFQAVEKNAHTLPAGNLTGKLLHKILETIPFSAMQKSASAKELSPWIQPLIQNTAYDPWEETICDIIFKALKTPLKDNFCLADIDPSLLYRETEFLYPCKKEIRGEELQWQAGFLKGVMDLVFYHEDQYYLVDWKSNWLGSCLECYTKEKMQAAMQQNDYNFQAHIYKEALKRYLKLIDLRPFEKIYGGCFYVFLRGLDPAYGNSSGVLVI